jgi:TolA-binding protein
MKWYVIMCLLVGGIYYVVDIGTAKDPVRDAINWSMKNYNPGLTPKVRYYGAWVYLKRDEYDKAQHAFTEYLIDYPTGQYAADALFNLGGAAEENRSWDLGKAALKKLLEEYPSYKDKDIAAKKLELLKYHHGSDVGELPTRDEYYGQQ